MNGAYFRLNTQTHIYLYGLQQKLDRLFWFFCSKLHYLFKQAYFESLIYYVSVEIKFAELWSYLKVRTSIVVSDNFQIKRYITLSLTWKVLQCHPFIATFEKNKEKVVSNRKVNLRCLLDTILFYKALFFEPRLCISQRKKYSKKPLWCIAIK